MSKRLKDCSKYLTKKISPIKSRLLVKAAFGIFIL